MDIHRDAAIVSFEYSSAREASLPRIIHEMSFTAYTGTVIRHVILWRVGKYGGS